MQIQCMNWESQSLSEAWEKFETHARLMFSSPLAEKNEIIKISQNIWVQEMDRDTRSSAL